MLRNSRTTDTNRAVRWLARNMPFHAEHHPHPAMPFHKLPLLHEVVRRHVRARPSIERGYAGFNRGPWLAAA